MNCYTYTSTDYAGAIQDSTPLVMRAAADVHASSRHHFDEDKLREAANSLISSARLIIMLLDHYAEAAEREAACECSAATEAAETEPPIF